MPHALARSLSGFATVMVLLWVGAASAQTSGADDQDYINPDRPGIADGSNVVGARHFQIETGLQAEFRQGEQPSTRIFFPTLLRYGIDKDWELRIEGNSFTHTATDDGTGARTREDDFAPTSIGVKYHFIESAGVARPSVGVIARLFPPSGSGNLHTTHATGDVRLVADWDFASNWSLNPNIGVGVYEGDANHPYQAGLVAMTLNYNPKKTLNLFIDTGIQTPETRHGKASVILDGGIAYIIGHDVQLDFSIGAGAAGLTTPHPFLSGGVSKRF